MSGEKNANGDCHIFLMAHKAAANWRAANDGSKRLIGAELLTLMPVEATVPLSVFIGADYVVLLAYRGNPYCLSVSYRLRNGENDCAYLQSVDGHNLYHKLHNVLDLVEGVQSVPQPEPESPPRAIPYFEQFSMHANRYMAGDRGIAEIALMDLLPLRPDKIHSVASDGAFFVILTSGGSGKLIAQWVSESSGSGYRILQSPDIDLATAESLASQTLPGFKRRVLTVWAALRGDFDQ